MSKLVRMKIAFLLPSLANRGPIVVARDIVKHIVGKVDKVKVFYFDDTVELDFDCEVAKISFFGSTDFSEFDVIHSHCLRPDVFIKFRSYFKSGHSVSTIHNYIDDDLGDKYSKLVTKIFSKIWCWSLSAHDTVVCLSQHAVGYYSGKINNALTCIYNGRDYHCNGQIDTSDSECIEAFKSRYMLIGASCLLTKRKGLEHVIKFLARDQRYGFLVIGDGPERENLLHLAISLNVADRCLFLGYRNGAVSLYKYFDFFAIPSRSEGFPLALIEAASCSLPIICSNLPIFKEVFTENEVVFFSLDDDDSFAAGMNLLESKSESLSKNVHSKYSGNYTAEIMANNYLNLYKSVAQGIV